MYLTRDAILNANDLLSKDVAVPEWGGTVRVRMMTGQERDLFDADCLKRQGDGGNHEARLANMRARIVAICVVDADGRPVFTADDVEALGAKSGRALDRVFDVASKLNGLTSDDVKELVGN